MKNKRLIESLENGIQHLEEELRMIMVAEMSYFKQSLKVGVDCRDSGLGWVLKKLRHLSSSTNGNGNSGDKESLNNVNILTLANNNNHK